MRMVPRIIALHLEHCQHGLPEPAAAEQSDQPLTSLQSDQLTRKEILSVCHDRMGLVDILETDISTAHRIRPSGKDVPRPVIVRFTSRGARDSVLRARKALRSTPPQSNTSPIYINEHLTHRNAQLFSHAKKLAKEGNIHSTWTAGRITHVRQSDSSEAKAIKIRSMEDFDKALTI